MRQQPRLWLALTFVAIAAASPSVDWAGAGREQDDGGYGEAAPQESRPDGSGQRELPQPQQPQQQQPDGQRGEVGQQPAAARVEAPQRRPLTPPAGPNPEPRQGHHPAGDGHAPSVLRGGYAGQTTTECVAEGCRSRGGGSPGGTDRQEILGARGRGRAAAKGRGGRARRAQARNDVPLDELGLGEKHPSGDRGAVLGMHDYFIPVGTPLPRTGQGLLLFGLVGATLMLLGVALQRRTALPT